MEKPERKCPNVIVLAGGGSERMGTPKGLLHHGTGTWIESQFAALERCGLRRAQVVLGSHAAEYRAAVPAFASGAFGRLEIGVSLNPLPARGPFSSLQIGLHDLFGAAAQGPGCFVLPVDVPCPSAEVWDALESAGGWASVPTFEKGGGHPVWLSPDFIESIRSLPPDDRLDLRLRALPPDRLRRIEVKDPLVRLNLNTPGDWERARPGKND